MTTAWETIPIDQECAEKRAILVPDCVHPYGRQAALDKNVAGQAGNRPEQREQRRENNTDTEAEAVVPKKLGTAS